MSTHFFNFSSRIHSKQLYAEAFEVAYEASNFESAGHIAELWGKRGKAAESYMKAQALEKAAILVVEGERVFLKESFVEYCLTGKHPPKGSRGTRSPILAGEKRQQLIKSLGSSSNPALKRRLRELEQLSTLLAFKNLAVAGFALVSTKIKSDEDMHELCATETIHDAFEKHESREKQLREYIWKLIRDSKSCKDDMKMPSGLEDVLAFFEVRDVVDGGFDIPFKVGLHVPLNEDSKAGDTSLDISYTDWNTFKTRSLKVNL